MGRFYVGQRVRIKWSNHWPELNGSVGTIIAPRDPFIPYKGTPGDWAVAPDAWGTAMAPLSASTTGQFVPKEKQLEPATDANEKTTWEECAWCPEHMRETV